VTYHIQKRSSWWLLFFSESEFGIGEHVIRLYLFDGTTAVLKGGRSYIHATDIVPFLDVCAAETYGNCHLSQVEFHSPLTKVGALMIGMLPDSVSRENVAATGQMQVVDSKSVSFCVFPTPLELTNKRPFDENILIKSCLVADGGEHCGMDDTGVGSLMEHLSSAMKALCQTALPHHKRWWFVRFEKSAGLPMNFQYFKLTRTRVVLSRMVTASLSIDGVGFGTITFVGGQE
jgi:hypothetical protein